MLIAISGLPRIATNGGFYENNVFQLSDNISFKGLMNFIIPPDRSEPKKMDKIIHVGHMLKNSWCS